MGVKVQILSVLDEQMESKKCIEIVDKLLKSYSGYIDDECFFVLNDVGDEDFDPEQVEDPDMCLEKIGAWPTSGAIDYWMPGGIIGVNFFGEKEYFIDAVVIYILKSVYFDNEYKEMYDKLTEELHFNLDARRTISGWGLDEMGFSWEEELDRQKSSNCLEHNEIILDCRK